MVIDERTATIRAAGLVRLTGMGLCLLLALAATSGCTFDTRRNGPSAVNGVDQDVDNEIGQIGDAADDDGAGSIGEDGSGEDGSGEDGAGDAGGSGDAVNGGDAVNDTVGNDTVGNDTVGNGCPGAADCPCNTNTECTGGLTCSDLGDGKRCTPPCDAANECPSGEVCVSTTPGAAPVCASASGRLCDPCEQSATCSHAATPGAKCAKYGQEGAFCATACTSVKDCGDGYTCLKTTTTEGETAQLCVRVDPQGATKTCECSDFAAKFSLATTCVAQAVSETGEVLASCTGTRACTNQGLQACSAQVPSDEVCNGLDDDCNGKTDESDAAKCDDGNACTQDQCDPDVGCQNAALSEGAGCDDGSACTEFDTCQGGACNALPIDCDDGQPCTTDSCDAETGKCISVTGEGTECSDGNPCTDKDFCLGGACKSGAAKSCADDDPCTSDTCDFTGSCKNTIDLGCTAECTTNKQCGDNANPCLANRCDVAAGKCVIEKTSGAVCSDGDPCTSGDICATGSCAPGKDLPSECDDGNACTTSECDSKTGKCSQKNAPTGAPCVGGNGCATSKCDNQAKCVTAEGQSCDDGNPCTADTCDPATAACVHTPSPVGTKCSDGSACTAEDVCKITAAGTTCEGTADGCDDGDPCTKDGCAVIAGKSGCTHAPVADGNGGGNDGGDSSCDDGDACTQADVCAAGKCAGSPKTCDDGDVCTTDSCDAATGKCSVVQSTGPCDDGDGCTTGESCADGKCGGGTSVSCDDGDPCTTDACGADGKCGSTVITGCGADCKNDDECPSAVGCLQGACSSGKCTTIAKADGAVCADATQCQSGPSTCAKGQCKTAAVKDCNDNNVCTDDSCDATTGCVNKNKVDTGCDDGNACTKEDACKIGACVGSAVSCDDGNPCTQDACAPETGCVAKPVALACDDGDGCTVNDVCTDGTCKTGAAKVCDDANACTDNGCDSKTGSCVHPDNTAKCDDGDKCTGADVCKAGKCGGTSAKCDDGNLCTDDSCSATKGCENAQNTAGCDDGSACTSGDKCKGGACNGAIVKCDDGNPCTADSCDAKKGCLSSAADGQCDDGNVCTSGDKCSDGACGGANVVCDDGNVCTDDDCLSDSGKGCTSVSNTAKCDDGDKCTATDQCAGGKCGGSGGVECDDGNTCTTNSCDKDTGCFAKPKSGDCSDGNPCTDKDQCAGGACSGGLPVSCDDNNACTTDSCGSKTGCTAEINTLACDDGDSCTNKDACAAGKCVGGGKVVCNDANPCTTDLCNTKQGCLAENNTEPCDDNSVCTNNDACSGGKCVGGEAVKCDDTNPCTADSCDATKGCVTQPQAGTCDDNNACTKEDKCQAGKCGGASVSCNDGNPCTNDTCIAPGGCVANNNTASCDDGDVCTPTDKCGGGKCVGTGAIVCNDSNPCTTDFCAEKSGCSAKNDDNRGCDDNDPCTLTDSCKSGKCVSAGAPDCDDGNPCTADSCVAKKGCASSPAAAVCDDNNKCTKEDKCTNGKCGGASVSCNDGNLCTDDTCIAPGGCVATNNAASCDDNNPCTTTDKCAAGKCAGGNATVCNDQNACTSDACDPKSGCVFTNTTSGCDDGDKCTDGDKCGGGKCGGNAITCDDGDVCTDDSCSAATGCTTSPNTAACNDGDACTGKDVCGKGVCKGTVQPCDDGNACTTGDLCTNGGSGCVGKAITCDDGNACTDDSCNAASGCVATNNSAACSDGSQCTTGDKCAGGACGGAPLTCTDGNVCTDDSCKADSGCVFAANAVACDDNNVCTGKDVCSGGKCAGNPGAACDDGDVCTDDSCDAKLGCQTTHNTAGCNDNNACTNNDKCAAGKCGGSTVTCTDGNACTDDSCNATKGCEFANNTAGCDDGDVCTSKDKCAAGKCAGSGFCDDSNPCTVDSCDVNGTCVNKQDNSSCDDGNACTDDVCSPQSGCVNQNNSAVCNAANACTGAGTCSGGQCVTNKGVFIETLAGSTSGHADGNGSTARFNRPMGMEWSEAANGFYVADQDNHRIRFVKPNGSVQTVAGSGNAGLLNGEGINAMFRQPRDVAVDSKGSVFVADYGNGSIRKISGNSSVTTFAGTGVQGYADGAVNAARFNRPNGIAATHVDVVFVADTNNHRIRKIEDGEVVTMAGGSGGYADGPGATARFNLPRGIAIDGDGDLLVADSNNNRIRRVTQAGVVTTIAGNGVYGYGDGGAETASFRAPWELVADLAGNVWIADRNNSRIRKLRNNVVTTEAGVGFGFTDGNALNARFRYPEGLAVDSKGLLYIADDQNHRIRRLRNTQSACSVGGSCYVEGFPNPKARCQVCAPKSSESAFTALAPATACSDGNFCSKDDKCDAQGSCSGANLGCDDKDACTVDSCSSASGLCRFDPIVGCNGYCAQDSDCDDKNGCTVDACVNDKCTNAPSGDACDDGNPCTLGDVCSNGTCAAGNLNLVATVAGSGTQGYADGSATAARFAHPRDVAVGKDGSLYVADIVNHRIRRIINQAVVTTFAGSGNAGLADGTGTQAWFNNPNGVATHFPSGDLYVADSQNHAVRRIGTNGAVTTIAGNGSAGSNDGVGGTARFSYPVGIAVTNNRTVYIADYNNHRIRRIAPNLTVTRIAGTGTSGFKDGSALTAQFSRPADIALDLSGNLYIADRFNHRIRLLTTTGIVTTVAGSGNTGSIDGGAANATFNYPWGITVDSAGRVFVADRNNFRIRMIHKGLVFTAAGLTSVGNTDGPGPNARFSYPSGMGIGPTGVVFIADQINHKIRSLTVSDGACNISGTCYSGGLQNPANACQSCEGATKATDWTTRANNDACLDGDYCTVNDTCVNGTCDGAPLSCNDGDACTADSCDAGTGACTFAPIAGCN